jgi:hypothetical protein
MNYRSAGCRDIRRDHNKPGAHFVPWQAMQFQSWKQACRNSDGERAGAV